MGAYGGPDIITDGLMFAVDAGSTRSYPGTGTTVDSLVGSLTGTLTNGVGFSSVNSGTFVFDGTDDHIDTPGYDLGAGELTISCWIYKSENAEASGEGIISKSSANKREFHLRIEDSPLNTIQLWKSDTGAGAGNVFDTNIPIVLNEWQHIGVTMNTTNVEFYLNGENVKSYSGNYTLFYSDAPIRIGGWSEGGGYYFNGKISKVNVYNTALTAAEVLQNYNAQKNRFI